MSCSAKKRHAAVALGLALSLGAFGLVGCAASTAGAADGSAAAAADSAAESTATSTSADAEAAASAVSAAVGNDAAVRLLDATDLFSDRDLDDSYDEAEAVRIELSDAGTTVTGSGATVDGSTVTITAEGTYILSGTLSDGQVIVDVADEDAKVQLVLDGASIMSTSSAALYVRQADKVFVTLAPSSQNSLSTSGGFVAIDDNNIDGAIFSKDDLTINGSGALTVSCAAGHGIVCKDDLTLVSGTVDVTASGHAIQAKDSVAVAGGTWTLAAGTDGIHAENTDDSTLGYIYVAGGTISIDADSDGFDAANVLQVDGGAITVEAGDDGLHAEYDLVINGGSVAVCESYEGLEGSSVTITGGTIDVVSSDDGINAAGDPAGEQAQSEAAAEGQFSFGMSPMSDPMGDYDETAQVTISGGTIYVQAGGDGIDSNGDLTVSGGETYVSGPTSDGDGSLDYPGTGTITGGIVVCMGSSGMAQNFSDASGQGSMLVSASGQAGDAVVLTDAEGAVLAQATAATSYTCVLVSAPGVAAGETYTLTCGDVATEVSMDTDVYSRVGGFGGAAGVGAGAGQPGGDMGGGPGGDQPGGQGGGPGGDFDPTSGGQPGTSA